MFDESVGGRLEDVGARELLAAARREQAAARRAEVGLLRCALQWAALHPAADGGPDGPGATAAAVFLDAGGVEPIAGQGCPGVAEFSVAEFGAELGLGTTAAKRLLGHAQELAHRLPRLWRRVLDGEVDPWRARRVAEATIHADPRLTLEAAGWVDAQVAPFVGRVSQAQVERLVAAAVERFHLDTTTADRDAPEENAAVLHVTLGDDGQHPDGGRATATIDVTATLRVPDALDLDHVLRAGAAELKALGSTAPLGARRAHALGHLARRQTALDLTAADHADHAAANSAKPPARPARRLDLHLHFAVDPHGVSALGLLEQGQRLVRRDDVLTWLGDSLAEVRVLPVLDLNTELASSGYVPSPVLRRQVQLRDTTCVFPWCSRPARACDLDHVVPYTSPGTAAPDPDPDPADEDPEPQTRSGNLATLCRSHHRLKTHNCWRLESPSNGVFLWTSPHGHTYRRDSTGTTRLTHS